MFAGVFKESDRVHACPAVATTQQRDVWTHHTRVSLVTDMEDRNLDYKYSVMPFLFYPEEYNNEDSLSDLPSTDPTPYPGPPSEKPTK